jgi:S1-C subfamily serine protease
VEWSQSDGAWEEGDDDAYPPAPVPAHERTWRHPSEMGEAAWTLSEPPLVLGRGLMITTGAIGCALGLAILWLMVPSRGGLAPSASASSSVTLRSTSTVVTAAPPTTDGRIDEPVETTMLLAALFGGATLPAEDVPGNTMHVDRGAESEMAIAVAIGDSPYLVTTARAVDGQSVVSIRLESGESAEATVVSIDATLAFIEPGADVDTVGFERAGTATLGDIVTVLSSSPATMAYGDPSALASLATAGIAEGTPVVDQDGAIVALCTRASGTIEMVPIEAFPDPATPPKQGAEQPEAAEPTAWIGVRLGGVDGATDLTVTAVAPGSPAEETGVNVGDEIVSLDGVPMASADQVIETIGDLAPGTTIALVVRSSSPGVPDLEREISLVLGERSPTVEL